jgi:hypothetical protein
MSTEEHDREAGRQLAWLLAVVAALAITGVVWLWAEVPAGYAVGIPAVLVGAAVLAFVRPVFAIRLVSGRHAELWDAWVGPQAKGPAQEVSRALRAEEEGTPLDVFVAERVVKTTAGRRRLGQVLMAAGALGFAACVTVAMAGPRVPEQLFVLPVFAFVGGLVVWYRTL